MVPRFACGDGLFPALRACSGGGARGYSVWRGVLRSRPLDKSGGVCCLSVILGNERQPMRQVARLSFLGPSIAWVLAAALIALLLVLAGGAGRAAAAADCKFVLGFKALHAMIPDTVGACLENEQHHPGKGVTLQRTKNGLLVWQKASNHTAFTDGHRTWVQRPPGSPEAAQYRAASTGSATRRRSSASVLPSAKPGQVYQGRQRRAAGLPLVAGLGTQ